jgi:Fe-S cluster biogenesis protein NfuA
MDAAREEQEFQERMAGIESLLADVLRLPDPAARANVQQIVQGLLDLHGAALERIVDSVAGLGQAGSALLDGLARDDLVGNVLLLYGLHPLDLESRVREALDNVRPLLRSHGSDVELLRVAGNAVRLRVQGGCDSCVSSAQTLKTAIEDAIFSKAPDVDNVEIEGLAATNGLHDRNGHARLALPIV